MQHVTLVQCALSYDRLYEVVSGTHCMALYLDIEVGRVGLGDGGLLSVEQMKLAASDAELWWAPFCTWHLDISTRRWSVEEYGCAQSLVVSYLRDFLWRVRGGTRVCETVNPETKMQGIRCREYQYPYSYKPKISGSSMPS